MASYGRGNWSYSQLRMCIHVHGHLWDQLDLPMALATMDWRKAYPCVPCWVFTRSVTGMWHPQVVCYVLLWCMWFPFATSLVFGAYRTSIGWLRLLEAQLCLILPSMPYVSMRIWRVILEPSISHTKDGRLLKGTTQLCPKQICKSNKLCRLSHLFRMIDQV